MSLLLTTYLLNMTIQSLNRQVVRHTANMALISISNLRYKPSLTSPE